jgi:serine/threonine-protein kinase
MGEPGERYDYQPGEIIPGTVYRVIEPLGQGGMGTVYKVEDTTIGKIYAMKTINREYAERLDLAARMRQEARILVSLRHPNIVDVITLGQTADDLKLLFIVMEYLEGASLKSVLRREGRAVQLELAHVLDIGVDVCDALEKAHTEGVVHRDIKPDNIFLVMGADGTKAKAVLLDFGIVGKRDEDAVEDRGQFFGTPRYAAPEQASGSRPKAQSDLYSLAVVLFEALVGHGPYPRAKGPVQLASAHLLEPPPRASSFLPNVNRDIDDLLLAAMQKNIADRVIVEKRFGRGIVLTASSMGSELRRIRREEDARQSQHVDENKTQETLLGVMNRGPVESTVDDPDIVARLVAAGPGRESTLVGLAPVAGTPAPEGERSGRSGPPQTPMMSASQDLFPAPPDAPDAAALLSGLPGGRADRVATRPPAVEPRAPPPARPLPAQPQAHTTANQGLQSFSRPAPQPLGPAAAATLPSAVSPIAEDTSSVPGAPDSWRRARAAMAMASEAAARASGAQGADAMNAAKARVALVGPAAGRLPVDDSAQRFASHARPPVGGQASMEPERAAGAAASGGEGSFDGVNARVPMVGPAAGGLGAEERAQRAAKQALAQLGIERSRETTYTPATRTVAPEGSARVPGTGPRAVHAIVLSAAATVALILTAAVVVFTRSSRHTPTTPAVTASAATDVSAPAPPAVTAAPSVAASSPIGPVDSAPPVATSTVSAAPNASAPAPRSAATAARPWSAPRATNMPQRMPVHAPPAASSPLSDVGDPFKDR